MPILTNTRQDIFLFAMELIDMFWKYNEAVRAIRICAFNLNSKNTIQMDIFTNIIHKSSLDTAIDNIRKRYGYFSLTPANKIKASTLDLPRIEV